MKPIKNHQFLVTFWSFWLQNPSERAFSRRCHPALCVLCGLSMPRFCGLPTNVKKWYNIIKGPELFWVFFPFWYFLLDLLFCPLSLLFAAFWSWKLPFNCLCNILELEPPIFHRICMEIAAFWSWKLPLQLYLHHFWISTSHFRWNLHGNCSLQDSRGHTKFQDQMDTAPSRGKGGATRFGSKQLFSLEISNPPLLLQCET